ncbi:MAG TPA: hypothetical protein VK800_12750 [Steroidobacteraceae bacterium]|jgi:hypothetical protein|nr:hypothetical protein [Steroidobacteraceae bacterium]
MTTPPEGAPGAPTDADLIRQQLEALGLSQRQAARQLDIDDRSMRYYCAGKQPVPPVVFLALRQIEQIRRNDQCLALLADGTMSTSDDPLTAERLRDNNRKLRSAIELLMQPLRPPLTPALEISEPAAENDLRSTFLGDQVDQSELEQLLQMHFGSASSQTSEEIQYARPQQAAALIVRYGDDGKPARIEPGPGLRPDDVPQIVDKIQRLLVDPADVAIGQIVLFARLPMSGYFRYQDLFQLIPVPPDAPRPRFALAQHPLLLQYRFPGSPDVMIKMLRSARVGRELELLCTALTFNIQGGMGNVVRHHWSLVGAENPATWRSEYCSEGYTWPGANGLPAAYSSLEGLQAVERMPAQSYYAQLGISVGQQLRLPDAFEELLGAYFARTPEDREKFMRASHWYQYAQRTSSYSHSGSYNALVSAVEALMPDAVPDSYCDCCRRPMGAGSTKRFVEFVERHAPGPAVTAKQRRELYSLRSALSHGGRLLHTDRFSWAGMTPAYVADFNNQQGLWQLVRLVLVNWLSSSA